MIPDVVQKCLFPGVLPDSSIHSAQTIVVSREVFIELTLSGSIHLEFSNVNSQIQGTSLVVVLSGIHLSRQQRLLRTSATSACKDIEKYGQNSPIKKGARQITRYIACLHRTNLTAKRY